MKNKRPYIYLAIAVVAALIVLAIESPRISRVSDVGDGYFIPDYATSDVATVEVAQLINGVRLARDGEEWLVSDFTTPMKQTLLEKEGRKIETPRRYAADSSRVENALGAFGGLEEGVLVSDNPEKQRFYRVGPAGLRVKGMDADGKTIFDIVIGKNGPDMASTYIRNAHEDKVYLVHRSLLGAFSTRVDDWRSKLIWNLHPKQIGRVEIASGDKKVIARRDPDGAWKIVESSDPKFDQKRLEKVLDRLRAVRAAGIANVTDRVATGLGDPDAVVRLTTRDGEDFILDIGKTTKTGKYFARREGDEDVYLLSKGFVDSIQP